MILFCAPGIPQSDKFGLYAVRISDLFNALNSVSVALGEAHCILSEVVVAFGAACHDVSVVVAILEEFPEVVEALLCMNNLFGGGTIDSADCQRRVTTCDVVVIAVELRESFFEDRTPDCSICSDLGVKGAVIFLIQRKVIVDNNCVRDTKGVKVHSVDTDRADLVHVVEEDLLHTAWVLSDGRGG